MNEIDAPNITRLKAIFNHWELALGQEAAATMTLATIMAGRPKQGRPKATGPDAPDVAAFIKQHCHAIAGTMMPFKEFFDRFTLGSPGWTKNEVVDAVCDAGFVYGTHTGNKRCIGNISWTQEEASTPWVEHRTRLVPSNKVPGGCRAN